MDLRHKTSFPITLLEFCLGTVPLAGDIPSHLKLSGRLDKLKVRMKSIAGVLLDLPLPADGLGLLLGYGLDFCKVLPALV